MSTSNAFAIKSVAKVPASELYFPEQSNVSPSSPAYHVMHVFSVFPPQLIDVDSSIDEALLVLEKTHNRTSFVVDKYNNLLGVISKARLQSSSILKIVAKTGIPRCDLTIGEVMVSKAKLNCITEHDVKSARVLDIVKLLEQEGDEHLLVVASGSQKIVGYFDLYDMAKMAGRSISQVKTAKSFTDIVDSLWHHSEM
ncbi:putative signal transduction protein with CBS domains [Pseudoalteromonas luteoviolacea B = ATCC 29581]|nr:putative signal transduction protein with CBS domains [Pseudoalteromonas luteoviolacea B = ATCC 29581]